MPRTPPITHATTTSPPAQAGHDQAAAQRAHRGLAPRQGGADGHEEQQGQADGQGHGVEVGGAHRDLLAAPRLVEQGEDRPEQHDEGQRHEEQVVQQERAFAADSGESIPPGDRSRSPRQAMRPTPVTTTTPKNPSSSRPDVGVGEGVHRLDHPRPGEERARGWSG